MSEVRLDQPQEEEVVINTDTQVEKSSKINKFWMIAVIVVFSLLLIYLLWPSSKKEVEMPTENVGMYQENIIRDQLQEQEKTFKEEKKNSATPIKEVETNNTYANEPAPIVVKETPDEREERLATKKATQTAQQSPIFFDLKVEKKQEIVKNDPPENDYYNSGYVELVGERFLEKRGR